MAADGPDVSNLDAQGCLLVRPSMPEAPELTTDDKSTIKDQVREGFRKLYPLDALPDALKLSERGVTAITLAEGSYSGLLVALWLDPAQAAQLAIPGGEPAENLHITLCYCSDMADTDDVTWARVIAAQADVAASYGELTGRVAGYGRFGASEHSDGQDVFWALPEIDGLEWFRESIMRAMGQAGVYASDERYWIPHITLQKLLPKAKTPAAPPMIDLAFSGITVVAGNRRVDIPFYNQTGTDYVGVYDSDLMYYAEKKASSRPSTGKAREAWKLSSRKQFASTSEWIQVLPAPGTYHHSVWGLLTLTPDRYDRMLQHFSDGTYMQTLPINAEHDQGSSGAVGWITDMRLGADGSIEVKPNWNDRGTALIDGDRFRYVSAEWWDEWQDPVSGEWIPDVFSGLAICTHPHFKTDVLRPLAASEIESLHFGESRKESIGMTEAENKDAASGAVQLSEADAKAFREFQAMGGAAKITELSEQNESLNKRAAALEADARQKRFTDLALGRGNSGDGVVWQGGVDKHVPFLTKLAEAFGDDSAEVAEYVEMQTTQAKAFAEASKHLLKPAGTSQGGDTPNSVMAQIEAEATKLREADPKLTKEQAIDRVYSTNPKLKEAYRAERPVYQSDAE